MKIILADDVEKLGKKGETMDVSDGYARNYLIPRGLALVANQKNMLVLKAEKDRMEKRKKHELSRIAKIVEKLNKTSVNIEVKTGEGEKLFGIVTKDDVADAIEKETGMKLDKHDILMEESIKNTGGYVVEVKVRLEGFADEPPKLAQVKLWVIGEK